MKKFLLIIFVFQTFLYSQYGKEADSLIRVVKQIDPNVSQTIVNQIIEIMYISEFDSGKALSDNLLKFSPHLQNKLLYIHALIHSYRFYPFEEKVKLLHKAEEVSIQTDNKLMLAESYHFLSIVFRDASRTDSAMIYALKAKDILEQNNLTENLNGVYELIGSMHFYAGQYDEAEKFFLRVQETFDPTVKNWGYVTMNNNIGLIRVKQNRFKEAEEYFLSSLKYLTSFQKWEISDSTGLSYIYRKLLEVNVKQGKADESEKYFWLAKWYSERFKQEDELPGIYAAKGELCYQLNQYDSAVYYFSLADELNKNLNDIGYQLSIYDGLAKTFTSLGKTKEANNFIRLYLDTKTKSDSIFYRARYMNIYAEHNYNNYKREIKGLKERETFLFIVFSIVSMSLISVTFFFIRLRKSNRKLVRKNIEAATARPLYTLPHYYEINETESPKPDPIIQEEEGSDSEKELKELDEEKIDLIIYNLESLMSKEKIYLDSKTTLNDIADKINTNRSYLSQAINKIYKVNFSNYLNELRIKEAINIITGGKSKNLNLEGIAQLAGFSNRVSFTKAFQKYTGVSPSFFMKNLDSSNQE